MKKEKKIKFKINKKMPLELLRIEEEKIIIYTNNYGNGSNK